MFHYRITLETVKVLKFQQKCQQCLGRVLIYER